MMITITITIAPSIAIPVSVSVAVAVTSAITISIIFSCFAALLFFQETFAVARFALEGYGVLFGGGC